LPNHFEKKMNDAPEEPKSTSKQEVFPRRNESSVGVKKTQDELKAAMLRS
jgi:hypothetical protein